MSSLEVSDDDMYSSDDEDNIIASMTSNSGLPQRTLSSTANLGGDVSNMMQSDTAVATVKMSGGFMRSGQNLYDSDSEDEEIMRDISENTMQCQPCRSDSLLSSKHDKISDDSTSSTLTSATVNSRKAKSFSSSTELTKTIKEDANEGIGILKHSVRNGSVDSNKSFRSSNGEEMPSSYTESRFNPFDRDLPVEEDHFEQENNNQRPKTHFGRLKSDSNASNSWTEVSTNSDDITFADLGLSEDHFSQPEGYFGMSSTEELEMAIETCKNMIVEALPHTDKQKNLVKKLVQLRLKLQELKEGPEPVEEGIVVVVGHKFELKAGTGSKHYCEKCNAVIWGLLQQWYRCTLCGYRSHEKCLHQVIRKCASVRVQEDPTYCLSICPDSGLSSQNYRCHECRSQISYKSGFSEPRICDYSGNYYCELCHWNEPMLIPARVLHNWDFEEMKVCRASKQFLKLMENKAVIRIQDINPMLFSLVDELNEVKKLREELLIMKQYILICALAMESKLLLQLQGRQHFVESSDIYTMRDLIDVQKDSLLSELVHVHSSWAQHIKTDCELCKAKGFICELCDMDEILFPFDNIAVVCSECSYVLHRHCFVKRNGTCPRCERRNKRRND